MHANVQKWTTRESLRVSCKLTSLTRLNEWRTTGALCDVTIKAGDGVTLHAHRAVLAVSSPYFFAMFTSGLQESSSGQITMETFSGQLLEQVINFMYTGGILLTVAVAQELLMLTDMLQMDQLKEKCEKFMLEHIDANNCLGMVQFGQKYSCCQLSDKAFSLVKKRFPVVVCSEDFLLLPQELLTEIIQTKDLYLGPTGEDVVLSALMKWIEHDMTSRIPSLHTLLPLINIASVSPLYLTILKQKSSISDNPEILSVLDEWASATFAGIDRIPQEHIYVIGGYFQSRTGPTCPRTPNVERFDVHSKEWSTVAPLPNLPSSIFAFNMQGRLLVISVVKIEVGSDVQRIWLFEYNYLEDNWRDLTLSVNAKVLDACKDALGVTGAMAYCSVRHCLYLLTIDAFYRVSIFEPDGDLVLDTVEVLAPLRRLSDMDTSKRHEDELTLTCHDGAVYAFGGTVRLSELDYWPSDQVSCYNSHTDRWMPGTPMLSARARVGAVSLGRSIYTVGGFGKLRENSVEKYNLEDDSWEDMAAMNSRRSHFCTVTAAGKIWAIAGKSYAFGCGGARKVLKTIESYDPSTDKWTTHEPMAVARCGFAAVVL